MSQQAQLYLINEIRKAVNYCVDEYDITWAEVVGCLKMTLQYMTTKAIEETFEEQSEKEEEPD